MGVNEIRLISQRIEFKKSQKKVLTNFENCDILKCGVQN